VAGRNTSGITPRKWERYIPSDREDNSKTEHKPSFHVGLRRSRYDYYQKESSMLAVEDYSVVSNTSMFVGERDCRRRIVAVDVRY
jgi:hypothetical protein